MHRSSLCEHDFITLKYSKIELWFSTAENGSNFNLDEGAKVDILNKIVSDLRLNDLGYNIQIHSPLVFNYQGEIHQGDGLITGKKKVALGVFTADCAPVMLFDEKNAVISAVHSGWRGTAAGITKNAILKMKQEYGCRAEDIKMVIGPHIKSCCYEVSEELALKFLKDTTGENQIIYPGNKLSLENVIINDAIYQGVAKDNILVLPYCTCCSSTRFHSYRRDKENAGRQLSFIFIEA